MWINPQETVDLFAFAKEILMENFLQGWFLKLNKSQKVSIKNCFPI